MVELLEPILTVVQLLVEQRCVFNVVFDALFIAVYFNNEMVIHGLATVVADQIA
jgi:hypothetical protein